VRVLASRVAALAESAVADRKPQQEQGSIMPGCEGARPCGKDDPAETGRDTQEKRCEQVFHDQEGFGTGSRTGSFAITGELPGDAFSPPPGSGSGVGRGAGGKDEAPAASGLIGAEGPRNERVIFPASPRGRDAGAGREP